MSQSNPLPAPELPEHARSWALFLDVDGTLLEIAPTPEAVVVPTGLVALLARLHDELGNALALVSGRPLEELDRLFAPHRFPAAGVHGAELRWEGGKTETGGTMRALGRARAAFALFVDRHPGTRTEDKGIAVALHYRQAPAAEGEARQLAADLAKQLGPDIEVLHGKMVVELRPRGVTKGRAVKTFLSAPPFAGRRPVYVGDDVTDEEAFTVVNRRGGISVLVGTQPSSLARTGLARPTDVRAWLADVARALQEDA